MLKKRSIFYGWWVLIFACLINIVGSGIAYYSFTIFFLPLRRDLALSSAAVSLLYSTGRLEGGFEGPLIGHLIDRLGPKKVVFVGTAMTGIGYMLLSQTRSFLTLLLVYILVVALGYNAGFFHPTSAVVNRWFIRRRGLTLGILTAAGALGGVILPPLISHLVLTFDWRTAAIIGGGIILAIAVPSAFGIRSSPEAQGLLPDGDSPRTSKISRQATVSTGQFPVETNYTVKEALHTPAFWLLSISISLRVLVTVALVAHFVPILVWKGMEEASAAYLVSLFALLSIPLTLVIGGLGDHLNKPLLCILGNMAVVLVMFWLAFTSSTAALYLFPVALATTMGTVPLNWAMIADFFGRDRYATLRGLTVVGCGIATFFSPIYAGWLFDSTGTYTSACISFAVIMLVASGVFATLRRPMPHPKPVAEQGRA